MNLQDAKLFRIKDKKMDWGKVKKVNIDILFYSMTVVIQTN